MTEKKSSGFLEELLKNKEDLIMTVLKLLEGKEAKTRLNLDGIEFSVGKSKAKIEGTIELTFIPYEESK